MANMELITSVTVGSGGASSVTLPATGTIPATYTDLKIMISIRSSSAGPYGQVLGLQFNSSTSNYSVKDLYGQGSGSGASGSYTTTTIGGVAYARLGDGGMTTPTQTSDTFMSGELYIPNYASSNYKSFSYDFVPENNATAVYNTTLLAGLWSDVSAITSIKFAPANGNFVEGSTFYLYGISNVTSGSKATGGIVSSDGTYWYHMFPYSGTFTPTIAISADVLTIAGGGGGGRRHGGGGGAGGLSYQSGRSLTATGYTVTVGAGGTGATSSGPGTTGSNSVFDTTTSLGGGGGIQTGTKSAGNGGSGGGSADYGTSATVGGAATQGNSGGATGYGNNGGAGKDNGSNSLVTGGGGGAGGVGQTAPNVSTPGNGGIGLNTWSAWASATSTGVSGYYAGGGGGASFSLSNGGSGGTGGGGAGGTSPVSGTANTGGGGGGEGPDNVNAGSGGSGLIIIRYAI
jgi:hypothetical protein